MGAKERSAIHTLDIDNYLNQYVPRPRFYLLPTPISFWFGYRPPRKSHTAASTRATSNLFVWIFSFIGGFIGIAIIENVFQALPLLGGTHAPIGIASFGAAAILEYNAIESPLSQPRNLIFGHFLSATIAVGITKLFHLLPEGRFEELRWLAGALSVGTASSFMAITKTVHPPAGATALLAATTPEMTDLGWWLLPLVLLGCCLMLASAMLVNNCYKRFPLFWWTPVDLSNLKQPNIVAAKDAEKGEAISSLHSTSDTELEDNAQPDPTRTGSDGASAKWDEGQLDTKEKKKVRNIHTDPELRVQIELDRIVVPDWLRLSQWEVVVLEGFQIRLRNGRPQEDE